METAHIKGPVRRPIIAVSSELTIVLGRGDIEDVPAPKLSLAVAYSFGAIGSSATVCIATNDRTGELLRHGELLTRVILMVAPAVITRLGATLPSSGELQRYHLPSELRSIALALRDCDMKGDACDIYRGAKGVELLCETFLRREAGLLAPCARESTLSHADSLRILAARQLIDERWSEKLTLERIAAFCGLNREKLTRGFRQMFDCTIAEAIAERRLSQASQMLLTTDLPVAVVGYDNGYLNNASFSRAFGRRFGLTPSTYRATRLAA